MARTASSPDLAKLAMEGFALLDQYYVVGSNTRSKPWGYHPVGTANARPDSIDCKTAAQLYGGVLVTDFRAKKPPKSAVPKPF